MTLKLVETEEQVLDRKEAEKQEHDAVVVAVEAFKKELSALGFESYVFATGKSRPHDDENEELRTLINIEGKGGHIKRVLAELNARVEEQTESNDPMATLRKLMKRLAEQEIKK